VSAYSGKALVKKLGFKPGELILVETTPGWYSQFADDNGLELTPGLPADHAHIFCQSKQDLRDFIDQEYLNDIEKSVWMSWPKKASKVNTDVGEQDLRDALLPLGWVDTKVAAIDGTWSGLKFLRRKN
jgi:hypothetical protein